MEFIDLFAGLGGFHLALRDLGHQCVFACEIDDQLRSLYKENFEREPKEDIRKIDIQNEIPKHDILCAGFPCQPFSQANHGGEGFDCPKWGNLFQYVIQILEAREPGYFILENVAYLKKHDDGKTWQKIQTDLKSVGYQVNEAFFSPHQFGIPQIRQRMFIVGSRSGVPCLPEPPPYVEPDIRDILDENPLKARQLPEQQTKCLTAWQNFLELFPDDVELPSVPIWSREFGATYPFKDETPYALEADKLRKYRGNHGILLKGLNDDEVWENLPAYAKREQNKFPSWKIQYIDQNRKFYEEHKSQIKKWIPQILNFPRTYQRFEWNCKGEDRNIWNLIIQFRGSGVRVKKPQTAPTLVVRSTQTPIIGWEKRYMTPTECARLQSIEGIKLPQPDSRALNALGNAVNVEIVKRIAEVLTSSSGNYTLREKQLHLFGTKVENHE